MSAYSSVFGVAVLLLQLWQTHSFPTSACPVPCLCQSGPLLNCSSLGLTKTPTHIPETAVSLNISNNSLRSLAPLSFGHVELKGLLHLWVGHNALENLSLILKKNWSGTRTLSSGTQQCTSWAPDLQLLSAERNHLKHLPKGLGCMKSLQILQLSYNQISEISLTDLSNCSHMKELHLQHNSITSIDPQAFIGLKQLQVLDLSHNLLVTIPVPAYQSLRNLNAFVDVSFNRWNCDCNLQALRKWISFDTEMNDASWQLVCASPPRHAGKDLLHLKDSELTCPTHEYSTSGHYHTLFVDEGMQISVPCTNDSQDMMRVHWWTPHGQVTDNQPELEIMDITEQHAGLYICVSGVQGEHLSVFDLHVYKKGSGSRLRREAAIMLEEQENINLPRNDPVVRQGTRTQSEFVLAVCLSVIITFILAFILGVLLRPLLEKLWRRIRSKRQSTSAPTTSFTEPQPYVNEGYCDVEAHECEVRVGSRVTFGGITEVEDQVPYYVTTENDQADGSSESNTEVEAFYEVVENDKSSITGGKHMALEVENPRGRVDSSSTSSEQDGEVNTLVINGQKLPPSSTEDMQKPMEFEPIPDPGDITQLMRRSSSSASSHSSQVKFTREIKDSEQSVDPPPVAIARNKKTKSGIPGLTTEPFSEWPTRLTEQNVDDLDPDLWNDSGESFSFTEGSERSSIRDLSSSSLGHPMKDDDKWRLGEVQSPSAKINFESDVGLSDFGKEVLVDDIKHFELSDKVSSSNSSESGDSMGEPNNYIVNPVLEENEILDESDTENDANLVTSNKFGILENFNERMPSAGILIRQETIILEPSDMHLTFTHGDSVDEVILTDDSPQGSEYVNISDKFGIFSDVGLDTVPKVKRYVEFKQFKPHSEQPTLPSFSPSSPKNTLTPTEVKSEANTDVSSGDIRSLIQTEVSPDRIQKVNRYIHFQKPELCSPILPSPSSTKQEAKQESKRYSSSSEDDDPLTTKDDGFFNAIDVSFDSYLKVKRYISFKQSDSSSPTLSESRPSTKIEATVTTILPSTSPKDTSQSIKKHIHFKKHEHHSSSLPSSPTSTRKSLSGKKLKNKKQNDQSYYGSHENLPLYHVHPVYRSSINRLNKGYDTDRSISSEDEDQFMEYPRKLEIKIAPEKNRGSITTGKNTDKVLNIDFDNSSSSTDVFEKKHSKGLMRLRALSARLFNRHENETDERRSPNGLDVGRTGGVSINKQSKLTKGQTTSEDILFGKSLSLDHLPKVKRYIEFSHSYPQIQIPFPPITTGVVTPDFKVTTESRRSSFSSEDDVKHTSEDENIVGQEDASFDVLPKVKRYIKFSHTESYSTTLPLNKETISPELVEQPKSKRLNTSSEDDIKSNEENFFRKLGVSVDTVPNVKRYIQFNQRTPCSPTPTSLPSVSLSSTKVTSDMEVKTEAKIDRSTGDQDYLAQMELSPENTKVKRYIRFKQSEPQYPTLPSSPSLTKKDTIVETSIYSSSSEDDIQLTEEDSYFREIDVSFDRVSKVKRYITFKHSEPTFPAPSISSPSTVFDTPTEAVKSTVSCTSKDDVRSQDDSDTFFAKIGVSFDSAQKVKQYLQFKENEDHPYQIQSKSSVSTSEVVKSGKVKADFRGSSSSFENNSNFGNLGIPLDRIPKVKKYIQFKQPPSDPPVVPLPTTSDKIHVTEERKSSSSSEDAEEDNVFGKAGASLDRVPRVKRYIQFTHPESPCTAQTTNGLSSERVNVSVVNKETRRLSTSSEEDVKPSSKELIVGEIPKVKRYITFTHSEPHSSDLSVLPPSSTVKSMKVTETEVRQPATRQSTSYIDDIQEDIGFGQIGVSLDRVPRVKRHIEFSHPETTTALSAEKVNASQITIEPSSNTSSETEFKTSTNKYNMTEETDKYLPKIPKVKRYIKFTQSEPYSSDLSPATTSSTIKSIKVTETELKQPATRVSTSSEDDVQEDDGFRCLDRVPRVKRYIEFTHSEYQSLAQSTSAVLTEKVGISGVVQDRRRPSTSSEGLEVTLTPKEEDVFIPTGATLHKIPKVKRYVQFANSDSKTLVQTTTDLSAERLGLSVQETRSSTSSEGDVKPSTHNSVERTESYDKIPKVKRYIKFKEPEPSQGLEPFPLSSTVKSIKTIESKGSSTSVEDEQQPQREDNVYGLTDERLDGVPRVKRYIQFTHQFTDQSKTSPTERAEISEVILETRRPSTLSEDNVTLSAKNYFVGHKGTPLEKIPKVKRYIQFTHPESQLPVQTTTNLSSERVNVSVVAKETKTPCTSSEGHVKPSTNENITEETGEFLDKIPKVKRYIEFTQYKPYFSGQTQLPSSDVVKSIKVTATELRGSSASVDSDMQSATNGNKTESMTQSMSLDNFDRVERVKRYIQFTPAESQYPAWSSAAISGVTRETKISSTSSKYVKPSTSDFNIIGETDQLFANIPKVKRYIQFTKSEPDSSAEKQFLSSSIVKSTNTVGAQETKIYRTPDDEERRNDDDFFQEIGVSLDKIPKVKRYIELRKSEPYSSLSSELSPPISKKKGSTLIIKTESESWMSDLGYKDNIMTRDTTDESMEQTGLNSELRKSLSSDIKPLRHQVMDEPPAVPQTSPPPLEQEDAREYLRENSEVRQRQERRRLLHQRRREMNEFNIASLSPMQQEGNRWERSLADYGGGTTFQPERINSNISTRNTSRRTEGTEAPVLRGLKTKNISTPGSKSPESSTTKNKEFLI